MISVIIPTVNEGPYICETIQQLKECEVIVVDGGSTDNTMGIAKKCGARVMKSKKRGRAVQLNLGAFHARGDILIFLHADSHLTRKHLAAVKQVVSQGYVGGKFPSHYIEKSWVLRMCSFFSKLYLFSFLGYGNQGLFCKKSVFKKYKEIDIMEDVDFYFHLWQKNKTKIIQLPLTTSGRRFKKNGYVRTLAMMIVIQLLYALQVAPSKLGKMYRSLKSG